MSNYSFSSLNLRNSVLLSNQRQLSRIYNFCNKTTTDPIACVFGTNETEQPCFPEAPYDMSGTLLIVGGLGYIGVNTINTIFDKFPYLSFVVLDNLSASNANPINILETIRDDMRYTFINGSMQDVLLVQSILTDYNVSLILHLAAYLPWQDASNSEFLQNNVNGLDTFFETCAPYCENGQIKNILYQSSLLAIMESSFVNNSTNYTNTFPQPPNIYSTTKAAAAGIASYYNRYGVRMPITIMFPSHVFGGDYQHIEDELLYYQTQLDVSMNPLLVRPYFNINYDNWISVYDIIDAYILILLKGYDGSTYNLVNPSQTFTYLDTAVKVIQQLKPGQPVNDWLESTPLIGALDGQAQGFIRPSNLPCFNPTITLQTEINKMPIPILYNNTYQFKPVW
jgi:nucleoside-diphosphate-sugar epimerase